MLKTNLNQEMTIQKTIMTARLFDGFWERWIAHGIDLEDINKGKNQFFEIDDWINYFQQCAFSYENKALLSRANYQFIQAEQYYRKAGLYYNLMQWIYPNRCEEKIGFYKQSIEFFKKADYISDVHTKIVKVSVEGHYCVGRVRIPTYYKGCMLIINPIDSSKEELYTYEEHFLKLGFITISFDGPGQGESFILNNVIATNNLWHLFLNEIINYAHLSFPNLEISLFGTSSGAAWAIHGSKHPLVFKSIAVSPPIANKASIPGYFEERLEYVTEKPTNILPNLIEVTECKSVLLFHGNKDVMVTDDDIYKLFISLPEPKHLVEYAEEGHCCNNKLHEVREISKKWLNLGENNENCI
ncbi:alpha/beta hydrolase [Psychrobacillus sp. PGGUH221]|uniref:alpha/beta hydrolase family protein n=1 Tax=Psychrobacillus sp. PGGUH221 TaxID=3020058 RepID=UPI0035C75316